MLLREINQLDLGALDRARALDSRSALPYAALAEAQMQTRRYAKRQSTWFRNRMADWERVDAGADIASRLAEDGRSATGDLTS